MVIFQTDQQAADVVEFQDVAGRECGRVDVSALAADEIEALLDARGLRQFYPCN